MDKCAKCEKSDDTVKRYIGGFFHPDCIEELIAEFMAEKSK